jgi:hypothetical protein
LTEPRISARSLYAVLMPRGTGRRYNTVTRKPVSPDIRHTEYIL